MHSYCFFLQSLQFSQQINQIKSAQGRVSNSTKCTPHYVTLVVKCYAGKCVVRRYFALLRRVCEVEKSDCQLRHVSLRYYATDCNGMEMAFICLDFGVCRPFTVKRHFQTRHNKLLKGGSGTQSIDRKLLSSKTHCNSLALCINLQNLKTLLQQGVVLLTLSLNVENCSLTTDT